MAGAIDFIEHQEAHRSGRDVRHKRGVVGTERPHLLERDGVGLGPPREAHNREQTTCDQDAARRPHSA